MISIKKIYWSDLKHDNCFLNIVRLIASVTNWKQYMKMKPASKVKKKATADAAARMFKVITSGGITIVNKALMTTYGFNFGMFLLTLHLHKCISLLPL